MGMVALTMRVMPESPDIDLDRIKREIKNIVDVKDIKEVPIAFGLKILEVLLVFDDKEGFGDIEEKIRNIKGVSSVEGGNVTLL
ncbi:MAG: elongation factor 1-beta [Candidatus Aenigmatarchaeota archaeon]